MYCVTYDAGDFWVSKYGPIEILENLPNGYRRIRFLKTGNEQVVTKGQIKRRNVVDVVGEPCWDNLHIVVTNREEADRYVSTCQSELN